MTSNSSSPFSADERRRHFVRKAFKTLPLYAVLIVVSAFFLLPFYLIIRNALMPDRQITAFDWHWLPHPIDGSNFHHLFLDSDAPMLTGLLNSSIVSIITTAAQLLFSSMAGYALARIPVRGSTVAFAVIVSTLMVPTTVTFVPTYAVVAALGGVDTLWGIIAPCIFSGFSTLLFRQFYLDFPAEIEEAGRMDGLGYFGIYWHLLLPNSKSIFAALGAMAFVGSWNGFLWPLVIGQDESKWTVQVVVSTFMTSQSVQLGPLFMAAAIAMAPPLAVFFVLQRFIVQGTTASGIKG
jgi:multiple sugar transport system permease protein